MNKKRNNSLSTTFCQLVTLLMTLFAAGLVHAEKPPVNEKPKMLMVTQSKGFRHGSVNRKDELMAPAEKAMKLLGRGFMFVKYGRQGRPKERLIKLHEKSAAKLVWTDGKAVKEKSAI